MADASSTTSGEPDEAGLTTGEPGVPTARLPLLLGVGLLFIGIALGLGSLWYQLHRSWTGSDMYSHGYLAAAMTLWLGWNTWHHRERTVLALAPDWRMLLPLALLLGGLVVLEILFLNAPRTYLLPLIVVASIAAAAGLPLARLLLWPVLFFYVALPVWLFLQVPLQTLTTAVVTPVLKATGVAAYIEGNFVYLPSGTFEIATDCSGLKYVIAATTLTLFCGLAWLERWRERLLLVGAALGLALLSNWVRVYTIILAGYLTEMQHYLVVEDHIVFGWVVFGLFMLPVLWLIRRLQPPLAPASPSRPTAGLAVSPQLPAAALLVAILLFVPQLVARTTAGTGAGLPVAALDLPQTTEATEPSPWKPVFTGASEGQVIAAYGPGTFEVYRAVYPWQTAEQRLIRHGQDWTGRGWRPVGETERVVVLEGRVATVLEYDGYFGQRRYLIMGWYWVAGEPAHTAIGAKLAELRGLLRSRRDAQAVAVLADCGTDCAATRERLLAFIEAQGGALRWQP